jgi:low affinity Fe/Cu permease
MTKQHLVDRGPYHSNDLFRRLASRTSRGVGNPWAFVVALSVVLVWGLTGPVFHYSDTWQLVINTSTTIVTFLMVFLIQNTQNRESHALHLKLDELIRASAPARNQLIDLEKLTDEELEALQGEFDALAKEKLAAQSERSVGSAEVAAQPDRPSKSSSSTTGPRSSRAT